MNDDDLYPVSSTILSMCFVKIKFAKSYKLKLRLIINIFATIIIIIIVANKRSACKIKNK